MLSQECFGMVLASLSAIPFCKWLGSSLPVFSRCAALGIDILSSLWKNCLTQSIWGEQADSSYGLAAPFYVWRQKMQRVPLAPNKWIKQFCSLSEVIRFEWAVCHWISKSDTCFGSLMLCCQAARQPSSGRLCYTYIEDNFSIRGFLLAVGIFEQTSREHRPCWQFWFTAAGRGMLKTLLAKIRGSNFKKKKKMSQWLGTEKNIFDLLVSITGILENNVFYLSRKSQAGTVWQRKPKVFSGKNAKCCLLLAVIRYKDMGAKQGSVNRQVWGWPRSSCWECIP